ADQQQEAKSQHFQRRMPVDKRADLASKHEHKSNCNDHRSDHHSYLFYPSHRSDHRVEREHNIQQQYLDNDAGKSWRKAPGDFAILNLQALMDLISALREKEQSTCQQY